MITVLSNHYCLLTALGGFAVRIPLKMISKILLCVTRLRAAGIVLLSAVLVLSAGPAKAAGKDFLSGREREWLAAHPVLTVAPDPDYPPIEYFDESGAYKGLAADYIALIEKEIGLKFRTVRLESWDRIIAAAKGREIDMFGAAAKTPQRSEYMLFTSPYVEFPSVIIVRTNVREILTLENLRGMKVAIVSGYADHDYVKIHYPELDLDVVPTVETGLRKVSFGMVDAFVGNLASATFNIEKEGISNLRVAGNSGYMYRLAFGVRKDWPELATILQKGLDQIRPDERKAIFNKWVRLEHESLFRSREFWISVLTVLGVGLLAIAGLVVWNRSLKAVVRKRTIELSVELSVRKKVEEALREARDELERRVEERTTELKTANEVLKAEIDVRNRAEQALLTAHQELEDIIEFLPDATFVVDNQKKIIAWNKALEEMTGVVKGEMLGCGDGAYSFPFYGRRKRLLIDFVMDGDKDLETRYDFVERRGHTVVGEAFVSEAREGRGAFLWSTAAPLFAKDGSVIGAIQSIRDISARKRAEEELRIYRDHLEDLVRERTAELARANELLTTEIDERKRAEEALKLFAYSVAHDLKSPAVGIYGLTRRLHKQYRDALGEKGMNYCDQILKVSEHIASFVEKLNLYIATKEARPVIENMRIGEILGMLREEFSPQLTRRHIEWIEPDFDVEIAADRLSILRVFRNLIDNALKYGGERLSRIRIGYEERENCHVFMVNDNGKGLKGVDPAAIFELFQRHETSRGVEGSGLGLAIVKEIVEQHGGKVWVEPGVRKGATFCVSIARRL